MGAVLRRGEEFNSTFAFDIMFLRQLYFEWREITVVNFV